MFSTILLIIKIQYLIYMKNLIFTSLSILIIILICLYLTKAETIFNRQVWCEGKSLIDYSR